MTANTVTAAIFGNLPDGREVRIFTLTNKNGLRARISEYGAILVAMEAPDRHGSLADLTHGFDTLAGWLANGPYFGASIGRFGNRIKGGKFSLDGKEYCLATNNAPGGIPCHLHGGNVGFDKVLWAGTAKGEQAVELIYLSEDGEEGYPGNLRVKVTYTLTDENELIWQAEAVADAPTPVNLVHHTYWNLSGDPSTLILDHQLMLTAAHYLPTNPGLIPTGEIAPVADTPMDFTTPHAIGERIEVEFEALQFGAGYDHCWVLPEGDGVRLAARVADPKSGRVMEILTDQPAIQFYAANFLDGITPGKNGVAYARRSALCLETEGFPDAPNQPAFPSALLLPGQTYLHTLVHRFGVA
ncbi:MAG: aldose epimerase family protein [Verrucomicrobiota bacterium]